MGHKLVCVMGISGVVAFSCGKKKTEEDTAVSDKVQVSSVADLNLSAAVNSLSAPGQLTSGRTKSSLTLTENESSFGLAGSKSSVACRLGESISDVTDMLRSSVASTACHFEVEEKFGNVMQIADGKIYKVKIIGMSNSLEESQTMAMKFTVGTDGSLKMYQCSAQGSGTMALKEVVTIDGATKEGKLKGSVSMKHTESGKTYRFLSKFDRKYTTATKSVAWAKMVYDGDSASEKFSRFMAMELNEGSGAKNQVYLSDSGTFGGSTFKNTGVAGMINDGFGAALFSFTTSGGSEGSQTGGYQEYFTSAGILASASDSAEYVSGGKLYYTTADVPENLASNFSIDDPSGWDCTGDATEFTLDFSNKSILDTLGRTRTQAHATCDQDKYSDRQCYNSEFGFGSPATVTPTKKIDDIVTATNL